MHSTSRTGERQLLEEVFRAGSQPKLLVDLLIQFASFVLQLSSASGHPRIGALHSQLNVPVTNRDARVGSSRNCCQDRRLYDIARYHREKTSDQSPIDRRAEARPSSVRKRFGASIRGNREL